MNEIKITDYFSPFPFFFLFSAPTPYIWAHPAFLYPHHSEICSTLPLASMPSSSSSICFAWQPSILYFLLCNNGVPLWIYIREWPLLVFKFSKSLILFILPCHSNYLQGTKGLATSSLTQPFPQPRSAFNAAPSLLLIQQYHGIKARSLANDTGLTGDMILKASIWALECIY